MATLRDNELRINLTTNRMCYRQYRRAVLDYAHRRGLDCEVGVNKGLWGVTLNVRMEGDREALRGFIRALRAHPNYEG